MNRVFFLLAVLALSVHVKALWAQSDSTAARAAYEAKHYREAIVHFQRAKQKQEASVQDELDLAHSYLLDGRIEEAADALVALESQIGTDADFLVVRGDLYVALGDWESAVGDYETALEKDPQWAELHLKLGQAYSHLSAPDVAEEHFQAYAKSVGTKD